MKNCFLIITIGLVIAACNDTRSTSAPQQSEVAVKTADTVIGSKIITDELSGSAYRKRAKGYFVIAGKVTSKFMCIFAESKEGGGVTMYLNIPYNQRSMTYHDRMAELQRILPVAAKDFQIDSLRSVSFGRLILSGDLAVNVTKQYIEKFGKNYKPGKDIQMEKFLGESELGRDINKVFELYPVSVSNVVTEKLFFTTKADLYWASKIVTDSAEVPERILDCITWVSMKLKPGK